jgi:hypothetical protein
MVKSIKSDLPIDRNAVRAEIYINAYILRPIDDNNTSLSYFTYLDPKLPSSI